MVSSRPDTTRHSNFFLSRGTAKSFNSRAVKTGSRAVAAACLLAASTLTGCMLSPWDEYVVRDQTESFSVFGFHEGPGVDIRFEAWNVPLERYDVLATARSESRATRINGRGDEAYAWGLLDRVTLDDDYWQPSRCEGSFARVRSRDSDGRPMASVIKDWGVCWSNNDQNVSLFLTRCLSHRSPETRIVSEDFRELAPDLSFPTRGLPATPGWREWATEVGLDHARYDRVEMRTVANGVTQVHPCHYLACKNRWVCRIPYPNEHGALARDIAQFGEIRIRARDTSACPGGPTFTDWSAPVEWYVADGVGRCPSPPPSSPPPSSPPPPPPGTWWNLRCRCANPNATTVAAVRACLYSGAEDVAAGANLTCGFAERRIESLIGVDVTCRLGTYADTGEGPCSPTGIFTIQSVN